MVPSQPLLESPCRQQSPRAPQKLEQRPLVSPQRCQQFCPECRSAAPVATGGSAVPASDEAAGGKDRSPRRAGIHQQGRAERDDRDMTHDPKILGVVLVLCRWVDVETL